MGEAMQEEAPTRPTYPAVHLGLYGEPQVGKSTMAATFPGPIYVAMFDRGGKELAYVKVWAKRYGALTTKEGVDETTGTRWMEYRAGKKRIGRIAYYTTTQVQTTDGVARLMGYWPQLEAEVESGKWATVVGDSVSFMALDARKQAQYVDNPNTKMPMQWYGAGTDMVEEILCNMVPNLRCNTVLIMHESKMHVEAEGTMVRAPAVPGKRLTQTNMVAATFPELYRVYAERDEQGKKVRRIQTDSDEHFQAGTIIGAPDGGKPTYEALWEQWKA